MVAQKVDTCDSPNFLADSVVVSLQLDPGAKGVARISIDTETMTSSIEIDFCPRLP